MLDLYINIKKLRIEKGMSQSELARLTGYTDRSSIAKIEKGEVDLTQSKIKAFASALNVTPVQLMGWDDNDYTVIKVAHSPTESVLSDRESAMLNTYRKLEKPRKDAVDQFTDFQYDQQLREAAPTLLAAHAHDGADPEAIQADLDIMADDSEWE